MAEHTCPNCGAALPPLLAHARMVNCDFCGSSIVLDGAVLRRAGEAGEMLDAPELIALGRAVRLPGGVFTATGHVRYDYGPGHWDEYHGDLSGEAVWISVDEGDVAVQRPVAGEVPAGAFRLGAVIGHGDESWTCAEVDNATAVAFRGQLPEPVTIGDVHLYANFQGPDGAILSAERWEDGSALFVGEWIDPFEVVEA